VGFGVRVKFTPNARAKEGGALDVVGAKLTFLAFGEAPSKLERGASKPAELVLHGAYLEKARNVSAPEFEKIATLSGQIELREGPLEPVFLLDPKSDFLYVEPLPEKGEPFRELRLEYPGTHFDAPPEDGDPLTRLRLPREPEGARFFELGAELIIAGVTEAGLDDNHRLDVPLGPLPGPIFEWPDELTAGFPAGLTLLLEEDGRKMAVDWSHGQVLGHLRRFVFSRLRGKGRCTLTAKMGSTELVLLKDQVIDDPAAPIRWDHRLEELIDFGAGPDDDAIVFLEASPEIVGTV
jgi:hypothetical protein